MAETAQPWREDAVRVDGTDLIVVKGGAGRPLLVLHDELGHAGWLKWHQALAKEHTLVIPLHPGYGRTERAEWMMSIRDLAGFYARYLKEQGLAPLDVIGFSLGGWIAAEMAASNPQQFRKIALVAPVGIRPPTGEILDFFQMMALQELLATVLEEEVVGELTLGAGSPIGVSASALEWERAVPQTGEDSAGLCIPCR